MAKCQKICSLVHRSTKIPNQFCLYFPYDFFIQYFSFVYFLWMSLSFGHWKSRNARQFTWFSSDIGELDAQQLRILVKKSTISNKGNLKTPLFVKCFYVMSLNLQFSLMHCSGNLLWNVFPHYMPQTYL